MKRNSFSVTVTLNFGARASGYYWGRVAGMLMRTLHRVVHVRHGMFIHVDDILATLDSRSSPIYASMIVLMCMCLGVPLSWKKTQLQSTVVWIGWEISTYHWTVTLTAEKRASILEDLNELLRVHKIPLKLLERLTGKLLWVTSAWHQLRPSLNPFYLTLSSPSPTLISLGLTEWTQLLQSLDERHIRLYTEGFEFFEWEISMCLPYSSCGNCPLEAAEFG